MAVFIAKLATNMNALPGWSELLPFNTIDFDGVFKNGSPLPRETAIDAHRQHTGTSMAFWMYGTDFGYSSQKLVSGVIQTIDAEHGVNPPEGGVTLWFSQYTFTNLSIDPSKFTNDLGTILSGKDSINGSDSSDVLLGYGGNDTIKAGLGQDTITGGAGADRLYGGDDVARDKFVFSRSDTGKTASTEDQVYQFHKAAHSTTANSDRIDLHLIDADSKMSGDQKLRFVSKFAAPAHGKPHGEVKLVTSGHDTKIEIDLDGNKSVDRIIVVHDVTGMHSYDLIL